MISCLRTAFLFLLTGFAIASNAQSDKTVIVTAPSGELSRSISSDRVEEHSPGSRITSGAVKISSDPSVHIITSSDPVTGATIDSQGVITVPTGQKVNPAVSLSSVATKQSARITIDQMTFGVIYSDQFDPNTGLVLFGPAKTYFLSDGSSWDSGAGSYYTSRAAFDRVEISGSIARYYFHPPAEGFVYNQTDYNSGDHSSNGSLGAVGPLVIEATLGSDIGHMIGEVEILTNTPANYPEPLFNYWSAPIGAIAPFNVSFTLLNGATFTATTFQSALTVVNEGSVDFAESRRPPLVEVDVVGTSQVPAGSTVPFYAIAIYEGGGREEVTDVADWTVTPADVASIDAGNLTTLAEGCVGVELELRATFTIDGITKVGVRNVQCRDATTGGVDEAWETYQGDERHTGYVPVTLDPSLFAVRWEKQVAPGFDLNPLTAADGKVFISTLAYFSGGDALFVLDAQDGHLLWSRNFGEVFSVKRSSGRRRSRSVDHPSGSKGCASSSGR